MRTTEQTAQIIDLMTASRTKEALELMEKTSSCPPCNQDCDQGRTCPARIHVSSDFEYTPAELTDVQNTWKRFGWLPAKGRARRELLS